MSCKLIITLYEKDNYGDVDGKLEVIARDGYFIFDFEHHNNFASKTCLKKSHHSYRKLEVIAGKRYCIFNSWYQCFFCSWNILSWLKVIEKQ